MVVRGQLQRTKPAVSIVVPVYNGAHYIVAAVERIKRILSHVTEEYEIVVVNDGSYDTTRYVMKKAYADDHRVKLISYVPNMGKGYAVKQGVLHAEGEDILFMDGDGDINPYLITSYIQSLKNADLIVGSKYHPDSRVKVPLMRKLLSLGFRILAKPLLNVNVSDTQVGLKAGKGETFKKIFSIVQVKKYAFDVEMLAVGSLLGVKIAEMPVEIQMSKGFKIKDMVRMFIDILGISYRLRVIKWYQRNMDRERPAYTPIFML